MSGILATSWGKKEDNKSVPSNISFLSYGITLHKILLYRKKNMVFNDRVFNPYVELCLCVLVPPT